MSLETTFYIIGIINMSLYTLLLIAIVVLLFYIKKKLTDVMEQVNAKVQTVKYAVQHPRETAETVGAAVAATALEEVAKMTKKKTKKRKSRR